LSAIINIINNIWYCRNHIRFQAKVHNWRLAINNIISAVALSGNNTSKFSNSSVRDLIILKKFSITIHPPKAPNIKEIIWQPPYANWMKCNTDGAASASTSSCGEIFRNNEATFSICFAENLGGGSA